VLAAAGDIARFDCIHCGDVLTASLIEQINPTVVLALGDEQYPSGALKDFQTGYDNTWGVFKDKTKPVPGDHEYLTPGAAGYTRYFGRAAKPKGKTYYSFDLGSWHLIALDSNIARGPGSAQERWLRADLRATSKRCVLAFWHAPRFASRSRRGGNPSVAAFWADLYAARAEAVLSGHWHLYERLAPMDPNGRADARRGIRQFVVGTAGGPFHRHSGRKLATSQRFFTGTHGVLKLTLHAASYTWQFVAVNASVKDSGGQACH
jgi:acid phosphatase type 7